MNTSIKVCPSIFAQVFTIFGTFKRKTKNHAKTYEVSLPFVYAPLTSKESVQYATFVRAVKSSETAAGIQNRRLRRIVTDFELAIINAYFEVFSNMTITACFFHLQQSVY